jgi:hypothetical protein
LVLEDASKFGHQHLAVMEDELERYREYREYADTGVQAAWDTLDAVIADLKNPPATDTKSMLAELRWMTQKVSTLDCDSSEVQALLRRAEADGCRDLKPQTAALVAEFDAAMGTAKSVLRDALARFEVTAIDEALMKYELVPSKEIRRMCAELRGHRHQVVRRLEGLEDLRGRLLRVLDSDDYASLTECLAEAEPYEVLVHERDAVTARRDAVVAGAVAELSRLIGNRDVPLSDVHGMLDRFRGYAAPMVKQAMLKLEAWAVELERISDNLESMRSMLQQAARSDQLSDVERVLNECSAHRHKRSLAREIFAAAERADYLAEKVRNRPLVFLITIPSHEDDTQPRTATGCRGDGGAGEEQPAQRHRERAAVVRDLQRCGGPCGALQPERPAARGG